MWSSQKLDTHHRASDRENESETRKPQKHLQLCKRIVTRTWPLYCTHNTSDTRPNGKRHKSNNNLCKPTGEGGKIPVHPKRQMNECEKSECLHRCVWCVCVCRNSSSDFRLGGNGNRLTKHRPCIWSHQSLSPLHWGHIDNICAVQITSVCDQTILLHDTKYCTFVRLDQT